MARKTAAVFGTILGGTGLVLLLSPYPLDGPARATMTAQEYVGSCPNNATQYRGSGRTISCTCSASDTRSGNVWGTDTYTDDSKICRAAVHAGVIGSSGGRVTFQITTGRASYPATSRNGVSTSSYGSWSGSYRFVSGGSSSGSGSGSGSSSSSSAGQVADIWNSYSCSFTDKSPLRLSSRARLDRVELWRNWPGGESSTAYQLVNSSGQTVHRGTLSRMSCDTYQNAWCVARDRPRVTLPAGRYSVRVPSGRICQNQSSSGQGFIRAWASAASGSSSAPNVSACPSNATSMRGTGRTLRCSCSGSATRSGTVWGTNTYTDDSKICRAAVHAGVIGSGGGIVTLRAVSGQSSYQASSRNGVSSTSYGNWSGSYRFVQ